jgi:hypothetical protein
LRRLGETVELRVSAAWRLKFGRDVERQTALRLPTESIETVFPAEFARGQFPGFLVALPLAAVGYHPRSNKVAEPMLRKIHTPPDGPISRPELRSGKQILWQKTLIWQSTSVQKAAESWRDDLTASTCPCTKFIGSATAPSALEELCGGIS